MKFNPREAKRIREPQLHELQSPSAGTVTAPKTDSAGSMSSPPENHPETPLGWWDRLNHRLHQWLVDLLEPRIILAVDPSGQTWWQAYNPRTHEMKWLSSETEARIWLDRQ
ncbi:hypothetical protein C7271_13460 [filamentous cyanobacterium CCP5]|nr:hypothetical protein C7271_13460 [filamentous cyanobacterium CCP5]